MADEQTALQVRSNSSPSRPEPNRRYWALNIIGIGVVLGLCYFGELVLVVILVSVLLAFILAPVVDFMMRARLPRSLAAADLRSRGLRTPIEFLGTCHSRIGRDARCASNCLYYPVPAGVSSGRA